jgi:hypothetical protein
MPQGTVLIEKLTVSHPVKKLPNILWNPKVPHQVHKSPQPAYRLLSVELYVFSARENLRKWP